MTENNYSYVIELGKTKFYKNGRFMTSSEVLNELEVKDMIINQFSEENNELKEERKGFESCSHNWGILYDEAKNKVEELSKENKELKRDRNYWKALAQSLARTNGNVKLKDEHLA